jgi:hypothetical protein
MRIISTVAGADLKSVDSTCRLHSLHAASREKYT